MDNSLIDSANENMFFASFFILLPIHKMDLSSTGMMKHEFLHYSYLYFSFIIEEQRSAVFRTII